MHKSNIERIAASFILAFSVIISGIIIVHAQTNSTSSPSVTFPIAELGNCTDQANCRTYCNLSEHMTACLDYASTHGLMSQDEITQARKMVTLATTGGPGGCTTKDQCEAYCASTDHLDECLSFAEKMNLVPQNALSEMKRIQAILKSGTDLPGGCTTKDQCEAYCADTAHMDQCVSFAEKAGILTGKNLEDAKKVLPFITKGQTPGGCTTKDQCEAYCSDATHTLECVSFAEKAGLISQEEAALVKKTGGVGPGGCTSKESCDAFCNLKENQDVCFTFAENNGLIKPEDLTAIKEGTARLRMGLSQFPQEVVQCLKDKLGADAVGKIESGQLVPNKELGDTIQGCFDQFKPKMQSKIQEGLSYATPEVLNCLQTELGPIDFEKMKQGTIDSPEKGDKVKSCFEKMQNAVQEQVQQGVERMNTIPAEARDCVKQKLGSDVFDRLQSGDPQKMAGINQSDIQSAVMSCMSQLRQAVPNIEGAPSGTIPTPEQIKQMMERQIEQQNISPSIPAIPSAPTEEQIKQMMEGGQIPQNIPTGPTPEQIQQMMRQQGIPQTIPQYSN